MGIEGTTDLTTPVVAPQITRDKFRHRSFKVSENKTVEIEFYKTNDSNQAVKDRDVLKNEMLEDGVTPDPANQNWTNLKTGFTLNDPHDGANPLNGTFFSLEVLDVAIRQLLVARGKID